MSAITTATDQTDETTAAGGWQADRIRLVRSLALVLINLAAAYAYAELARWLMPRLDPARHGMLYAIATGIPIAQTFLVSLWLALGCGRWWLRYAEGLAALVAGTLVALIGLWGGGFNVQTMRTVLVPLFPAAFALAVQLFAGLHLVLVLLRGTVGWSLDYRDLEEPAMVHRRTRRPFVSLAFIAAISLAVIWICGQVLRGAASSELFFHPRLLVTTLFAAALAPMAACAWLVFGSRWRWAAAVVIALTLAAPAVLITSGLGEALQLETPQLWVVHWINLSATAWAAANLLVLRSLGLRLVPRSR